jgi:hypothetical protein
LRHDSGVTAFTIVAPFLSLMLGAGLTYWLNVRTRHKTYVDGLFKGAISAVYIANATVDYTSHIGRPDRLSDQGWAELQDWLTTEGIKRWWIRQHEANEALASVRAFAPEVGVHMPFRVDIEHREVDGLVALLRRASADRAG